MILDYLNGALGQGTYHRTSKGTQYSYQCPFCRDHKERLFVHPHKQKYYCHNCSKGGSLITLVSEYAHISWMDALKIYRSHEGYEKQLPESLEEEIYRRFLSPDIQQEKYVYPLPEEFIPIESAIGRAGKKAIEYLYSRGISKECAERNYIGYCEIGQYENRIIMPDFESSELIYWQARTWEKAPTNPIYKKFFKKVLNPSLTEEQIQNGVIAVDKSEIISNIDLILEAGTGIICEGKMDSYTIGDLGGAIHGKVLSDAQFTKLAINKDKISDLFVMLDGDAFKYTVVTAERLNRHFDNVWVCKLPEDKDPNELGKKGILEVLDNAIRYTPMFTAKAKCLGWI